MKGEVLHYDDNVGTGQISGEDGIRYNFSRADLKQLVPIRAGTKVDFDFEGKQARDIYVVTPKQQAGYANAGAYNAPAQPQVYDGPVEPERSLWGYYVRTLTANYASFGGRARRKEYWGFALFTFIIYVVLYAVLFSGMMASTRGADGQVIVASPIMYIGMVLLGIYGLATIIPSLGLYVRRLHDIGWPGWSLIIMIVLCIIPFVGFLVGIAMLVIACLDSQPFTNKYGVPPKAIGPRGMVPA
jgi:uncharacterized membrane protein YhaH (DUF805 family)